MIVLDHQRGHVAVTQVAHARMCGELGRAWGNERFGAVAPAEEVVLAADQHELGMTEWDLSPTLDPATGLPTTVTNMEQATHLPLRIDGPRRLAGQSRYAALIASLHHTSFYRMPRAKLVRSHGRQIRRYLVRSAEFQAELRATLNAPKAEIERNWRLVRTWDGLSHDLMYARAPCTRRGAPAAQGELVDLDLRESDGAHTLDPWPFASERVVVRTEGRLLEGTFSEEQRLHDALAEAPLIELRYELIRP